MRDGKMGTLHFDISIDGLSRRYSISMYIIVYFQRYLINLVSSIGQITRQLLIHSNNVHFVTSH